MEQQYIYNFAITNPQSVQIDAFAEFCRLIGFEFSSMLTEAEFIEVRDEATKLGLRLGDIKRLPTEPERIA